LKEIASFSVRPIVLDDYLSAVEQMRRQFDLAQPAFGLTQIRSNRIAAEALAAIVTAIVDGCGSEVYSKVHPILGDSEGPIYAEYIEHPGLYSGYRINPESVRTALQLTLEVGLQTIVQLPGRDPEPNFSVRKVKSLSSKLKTLSGDMTALLTEHEMLERIRLAGREPGGWAQLSGFAAEMRRAADLLICSPR
jgi:hypothetical protein